MFTEFKFGSDTEKSQIQFQTTYSQPNQISLNQSPKCKPEHIGKP